MSFPKGPDDIDGCGNYYINVKNSEGIITQTLYMLDSHSYIDGDFLGIQWKYDNIHQNQIDWYVKTVDALNAENDAVYKSMNSDEKSDIKSLMFFHIPIGEQKEAWDEYAANGYQDTENARLIYGAAGEHDRVVYCGEHEDNLFETILEKESTKGIFFGHDHHNGFSMDYKGIRLTYGLTVDYLAYYGATEVGSQRGCTVINVAQNGNFDCRQENYYQDKYAARFEKETVTMQKLDWYRD